MRKVLALSICVLMMGTAAGAAAASSKSAKSSSKKSTATSGKTPSKRASTKKRSSKKTTARHRSPSQRTPTQQRYREIQQALQSKGYFSGEPDGAWGASSVEALKRFQQDQSLEATGKINSLSLIALGLGPKYEKVADTNQPPASVQPQENQ
jgi:peptidoglycan hydrolase-like protein with peptidoglycan-binding domain